MQLPLKPPQGCAQRTCARHRNHVRCSCGPPQAMESSNGNCAATDGPNQLGRMHSHRKNELHLQNLAEEELGCYPYSRSDKNQFTANSPARGARGQRISRVTGVASSLSL